MEAEEQTGALYDFLYRDSNRIASYYAQLFGGRLSSFEETDTTRDTLDTTGHATVGVVSGDLKSSKENQVSNKNVLDPHDVITADVLASLRRQNRIQTDIENAPHGALVLAKGTIVFVDRSMLEIADIAFEMEYENAKKTARTQEQRAHVQTIKQIRGFLAKVVIPSAFLLHTSDGLQVAGTIKESGMEEPISSYYFKHGTAGLADVYLVGIKETPTSSFSLPNTQLMGAGQQAAQALSDLVFPPEAIRVTPIALFREL